MPNSEVIDSTRISRYRTDGYHARIAPLLRKGRKPCAVRISRLMNSFSGSGPSPAVEQGSRVA